MAKKRKTRPRILLDGFMIIVADGIFLLIFAIESTIISMEEQHIATPEEVCRAVATDLRANGITHEKVAQTIGTSRSIVSNVLSSKKRFSKTMAARFSNAYGYNINYLLYGTGPMKSNQIFHGLATMPTDINSTTEENVMVLASLIECAEGILRVINDKDAIEAWEALTYGNFDGYITSMKRLSARHNYFMTNPILAKFVCDHVFGRAYIPIVTDLDKGTKKEPSDTNGDTW